MIVFFLLSLSACGYNETFIVTGEVEKIDQEKGFLYLKEVGPLKMKNIFNNQTGQILKITVRDTSGEDCWCPR